MTRVASLAAGTTLLDLLVLAATPVRADTLVVCSEASPDALNATLSDADTSFDVSEQMPIGWSRWRWAGRQ